MTEHPRRGEHPGTGPTTPGTPLVVEDLMLLLFDPRSGTIAGEGTLFYTLAGAVLTDLTLQGRVRISDRWTITGRQVSAVEGDPPADPLLREVWDRLGRRPEGVQALLAGIGPTLRGPVLDRLVEAGHVARRRRRVLRLFTTTSLVDGGTGRREELLDLVRPVLVDGAEPDPRTAVLGALLSASGSLPTLHRDIPWSGAVYTRGKELEAGDWGAAAAGAAVLRTTVAVATSTLAGITAVTHGR